MKKCFGIFLSFALMVSIFAQQAKTTRTATHLEEGPGIKFSQVFSERAPGQFDPDEYAQRQQDLFNHLVANQVQLSESALFSVALNDEDHARMEGLSECESCGTSKKLLVGIEKSAGIGIDFTNLKPGFRLKAPRLESNGMMATTQNGGYVWSSGVEAKGAVALRVHFSDFKLPANTSLYIYNDAGEAFGPYNGLGPNKDGEFWTHTLTGSVAYIQLRHSGPVTQQDLDNTVFVIEDIDYLGPKFLRAIYQNRQVVHNKTCSFNASCVENAECFGTGDFAAINDVRNAVASILYSSRGGLYICSGGLFETILIHPHKSLTS